MILVYNLKPQCHTGHVTLNDIVTNHVTEFDDVTLQNDEYNFWLYEHPIYPNIFPIYLFLIAVEINISLYSIWF